MALSDYSQQYRRLLEEASSFLGFGEVLEDLDAGDMRLVTRCVDAGLMEFLSPVNPKNGSLYRWTFSEKEIDITLPVGQFLVTLPKSVQDIEGDLRPRNAAGDNPNFNPIKRVSYRDCRWMLEHPAAYAFAPSSYAIADVNTLIENPPTPDLSTEAYSLGKGDFVAIFDHVSDREYSYTASVRLNPSRMQYASDTFFGGPEIFPHIVRAVLAQCEQKVLGEAGLNTQGLAESMAKAILIDSSRRNEFSGYMGDNSFGSDTTMDSLRDAIRFFGSP
jgi:hypothetical protein